MEHTLFEKDTTIRLACRAGDYLMWCGFEGMFLPAKDQYTINDLWRLSDGDFVTVTNRQVDLPSWFELHPLEVSNSLVYWMKNKLDSGYQPGEIIDGPNIWRALTGDRLVWVGERRPGVEYDNGILSIFTFKEDAAIIGEPLSEHDGFPCFGGWDKNQQTEVDMERCSNGWKAMSEFGMPHCVNADKKWAIG